MAAQVSDWLLPLSEPKRSAPIAQGGSTYITFAQDVWLNGSIFVKSGASVLFKILPNNFVKSGSTVASVILVDFLMSAVTVQGVTIGGFVKSNATVQGVSTGYVMSNATVVRPGFGAFAGFSGS